MFGKISNSKLLLGLAALIVIYLALNFLNKDQKSNLLKRELVKIDTTKVTGLLIEKPGQAVNLSKEAGVWQVELPTGKTINAEENMVKNTLGSLMKIKPSRLAAKEKAKWNDYQVDSTGTRVKVLEGGQVTLDLVLGNVQSNSYLRIFDQQEVYASDAFTGLTGKDQIDYYRRKVFTKFEIDSLQSIEFHYPNDSSFRMVNYQKGWGIPDASVDSTQIADYLRTISSLTSDKFSKEDGSTVGTPIAEVRINLKPESVLVIKALQHAGDSIVYNSSSNVDAYFNDPALGEKIFKGKQSFLNGSEGR